jgi:hypothetical protein
LDRPSFVSLQILAFTSTFAFDSKSVFLSLDFSGRTRFFPLWTFSPVVLGDFGLVVLPPRFWVDGRLVIEAAGEGISSSLLFVWLSDTVTTLCRKGSFRCANMARLSLEVNSSMASIFELLDDMAFRNADETVEALVASSMETPWEAMILNILCYSCDGLG